MPHSYYSQRMGVGPHPNGLPLKDVVDLFVRFFYQINEDGYFQEAFGSMNALTRALSQESFEYPESSYSSPITNAIYGPFKHTHSITAKMTSST